MIVEKKISERDFPNDAVEFSGLIIGECPDHDIPPSKVIQIGDFADLAGISAPFVCTTREISEGTNITRSDLELRQNQVYSLVSPFPPRPTSISAVVGKKARTSLKEGHELYNCDLIP